MRVRTRTITCTPCMMWIDASDGSKSGDSLTRRNEDVDGENDTCYFFNQQETKGLNQNWLLLDSQS